MRRTLIGREFYLVSRFRCADTVAFSVPAYLTLYYRLTIPKTPRYTFNVARDVEKAKENVEAYMVGKHEGTPDELARA